MHYWSSKRRAERKVSCALVQFHGTGDETLHHVGGAMQWLTHCRRSFALGEMLRPREAPGTVTRCYGVRGRSERRSDGAACFEAHELESIVNFDQVCCCCRAQKGRYGRTLCAVQERLMDVMRSAVEQLDRDNDDAGRNCMRRTDFVSCSQTKRLLKSLSTGFASTICLKVYRCSLASR